LAAERTLERLIAPQGCSCQSKGQSWHTLEVLVPWVISWGNRFPREEPWEATWRIWYAHEIRQVCGECKM